VTDLFSQKMEPWETRSITPANTFNKDQIRGVLGGFCRGLPFRYRGNAIEIESLEKEENWVNLNTCLKLSPRAKILCLGRKPEG
jgi:hypothetical protein